MVIWLNGAFGAGKTTVAHALGRRLKDSFIYDPENVGYFLRKNTPKVCDRPDFQDIPLWREFNYRTLSMMAWEHPGPIIVPMTLVEPQYWEEIIGRLVEEGVEVRHFILWADRKTLLRRLRGRSLGRLDREAFAVAAIDRCLKAFETEITQVRVDTEHLTAEEAALKIALACGLTPLPDDRGTLRRAADHLRMVAQHVRW